MTTKKLQLLATSCIPSEEKEAILRVWNSLKSIRVAKRFPVAPFPDSSFGTYLHKYVFWYQLKEKALEQLPSLLAEARCSEKLPSICFSQYIDSSRAQQWEYAFIEQIRNKEINKSQEWESSKNIHGHGAMLRLVYRYWLHVLLKEGVALEESPNFVDWCDLDEDECMFSASQIEAWGFEHLKLCHWYVEMSESDTPLHEQDNWHIAEPGYSRASVGGSSRAPAPANVAASRASARAPRAQGKSLATKAGTARVPDGGKGNKRGPQSSGRAPSKRGKVAAAESSDMHAQEAVAVVADSEAKSSKSNSTHSMSHGPAFTHGARQNLAIRETGGKPIDSLILNDSFSDMLASEKPMLRDRFQKFARKASFVLTVSLPYCGVQSPQS